jgi:hypothetical protein
MRRFSSAGAEPGMARALSAPRSLVQAIEIAKEKQSLLET